MVVPVESNGDKFSAGAPREIISISVKAVQGNTYDISADGKRLLVNTPLEEAALQPITLVQNWTARLRK